MSETNRFIEFYAINVNDKTDEFIIEGGKNG